MDELKPCPFCGGNDLMQRDDLSVSVEDCIQCQSCLVVNWVSEWNRRPIEDALMAEIERLNEQLQGFVTSNVELAETNIELLGRNDQLERENKILQIKAKSSLANNLCPDHCDKQAGKPCLACEIERLERKLTALKAKFEQLETLNNRLMKDSTEVFVKELVMKDGCLDMDLKTNPILESFAVWAWEMLVHNKAENFLTTILKSKDHPEAIVITFQRATGKTPSEKYGQAMTELAALKAKIDGAAVLVVESMNLGPCKAQFLLNEQGSTDIGIYEVPDGTKYRLVPVEE